MKSLKNNIIKILIIDLVCWAILCITDACDELGPTSDLSVYSFFIAPAILVILFSFFRKWMFGCLLPSIKRVLIVHGVSFAFNFILVFLSDVLIAEDLWIVPQANKILNGIEYPVFGIFMCLLAAAFVILELLGRAFIAVYKKAKKAEEL